MSISAISASSTVQATSDGSTAPAKTAAAAAPKSAPVDTVQIGAGKLASATSTGSTTGTKTYDKMDANKDGVVSAQEALSYELAHPAVQAATTKSSAGTEKEKGGGTTAEKTAGTTGIETYA